MPNQLEEIFWINLIPEIIAGQCILVIGPDLVSFGDDQTLFKVLSKHLTDHETFKDFINPSPYIFENEELIQPKSEVNDTWLYEFYRNFYHSRTELDESFLKIARLPFHIIISLLPDERLRGVFDEIGRPHQFHYYPCTEDKNKLEDIKDKPSREKPLLYNILGTVGTFKDPKLECVITFDHLFNYLQGILSDNRSLPLELAGRFLTAKTVLFLGVHFERWYMQVLLRALLPKNNTKKYSLLRGDANSEVSIFITERLSLKFLSIEPVSFLDELYRRCAAKNLLIPIKKKSKATVFVSYSHADMTIVNHITERLRQADIAVIRDQESMPIGERISRFMEKVKTVNAIVVIVSERSLHSPFVGKEILHALDAPENAVRLIPGYLDDQFTKSDLVQKIHDANNKRLQVIQSEIAIRKNKNPLDQTKDLKDEEDLRQEFGINLDRLIGALRDYKQGAMPSLIPGDDIQQVINFFADELINAILNSR